MTKSNGDDAKNKNDDKQLYHESLAGSAYTSQVGPIKVNTQTADEVDQSDDD